MTSKRKSRSTKVAEEMQQQSARDYALEQALKAILKPKSELRKVIESKALVMHDLKDIVDGKNKITLLYNTLIEHNVIDKETKLRTFRMTVKEIHNDVVAEHLKIDAALHTG